MYKRDANVEMKETLERLGQAVDKFAEVHAKDRDAKDDSSKEILEFLKKGGARDVKDVPAADLRADQLLRMPRGTVGMTGSAGALDFTSFTRFNTAVRAATGDLGAFQRSIFHTAAATTRARSLTERLAVVNEAIANAPTKYRAAGDDDITKLVNFMVGRGSTPDAMTKAMNLVGKYGLPGGEKSPSGERVFEIISDERYAKRAKAAAAWVEQGKTAKLTAEAQRLGASATSMRMAIGFGVTAAMVAAPFVLGHLINSKTLQRIEEKRPLANLDAGMATGYAQFGLNRLLVDMKHARGIGPSMNRLLGAQAEFEKTLEPIRTFSTKVQNRILAGGTSIMNTILRPFSKLTEELNKQKDNGVDDFLDQMEAGLNEVQIFGPHLAMMMKGFRAMAKDEELKPMKDGGPLGAFALNIQAQPVAPPQRFVP
jgi:hypothetical protein